MKTALFKIFIAHQHEFINVGLVMSSLGGNHAYQPIGVFSVQLSKQESGARFIYIKIGLWKTKQNNSASLFHY